MNEYQTQLKKKMDDYAHLVYRMSKKFSKDEIYGIVSLFRRSSLSIVLNYIEGYARFRSKV
jgi:four helix bundle protein